MSTEPTQQLDDGGPAFPFGQVSESTGQPINGFFNPGMSLRDWLAGQALSVVLSTDENGLFSTDRAKQSIAIACYKLADAMLAARKGGAQ